ncbi:Uncharacterized protein HA466_0059470 [Hirschfeldia incana]|nr:Uncharacterized protein HA466_0059470 [Hirschfeldia incana]
MVKIEKYKKKNNLVSSCGGSCLDKDKGSTAQDNNKVQRDQRRSRVGEGEEREREKKEGFINGGEIRQRPRGGKKMPVRVVENNAPAQVSGNDPGNRSPLPPSSLLAAGQSFSGTQNVSNQQKEEAWRVNVQIQGVDLEHGYLCGTMEALNVPMADTPVITFWEGEIVDGKNYTFYTGKWEATREDDMRHWSKFPSFAPLQGQVESDGGRQLDLSSYPYIFMRWKEQYFVNVGTDCGLTIAGFYYVCFSCSDGSISGFYYDPNSSPFQKLELKTVNEGRSGFSFSSYELQ